MSKKDETTKLLWLDMEMTGLDVEKELPIEVAGMITDWQFKDLSSFHAVIHQSPTILAAMDAWNQKHHKASGLLDLIPTGTDMRAVDQQLAAWIGQHFAQERAMLAGNSISQDRLFIRKYMPLTEQRLHYRMLDVTAWKVVFAGLWQRKFKKKEVHRAVEDVRESIEELKFYLSFVRTES